MHWAGYLLMLLCGLSHPWSIQAEEIASRSSVSRYGVLQFAGSNGMLSMGLGSELPSRRAAGELLLGYAPASVAGLDVFSLGAKIRYQFAPRRHEFVEFTPYLGLGAYYYLGEQYRINRAYPDDYYPYSAWHTLPYIGVMLQPFEGASQDGFLYMELGVLDHYLIHFVNNPDYLDWSDVISLSLGLRIPLQ